MRYAKLNPDGSVRSWSSQRDAEHTVSIPANAEGGWVKSGGQWVDPEAESKRTAKIKEKAREIIESGYPLWKQVNDERVLRRLKDRWTLFQVTTDKAEIDRLEAKQKWVDDVRAESERLEKDANATPNWPPMEGET